MHEIFGIGRVEESIIENDPRGIFCQQNIYRGENKRPKRGLTSTLHVSPRIIASSAVF